MIKPAHFVLKQILLLSLSLASIKAAEITYEANADYSYVGNGRMQNSITLSEQSNQVHFALSTPIGAENLLRIGTEWQRYSRPQMISLPYGYPSDCIILIRLKLAT